MRSFTKICIAVLAALLLLTTPSCKKEQAPEDIYLTLSGVWENDRDGAPLLYLIGAEELKMYLYTYPYPVEEADQDAGWFEVDTQKGTMVFTNSLTLKQVTYSYVLSNGGNTLQLNNTIYKRSDLN